MSNREANKIYIQQKLHGLLEELTTAILSVKPNNVPQFMLEWLLQKSSDALSQAEREELQRLRQSVQRMQDAPREEHPPSDASEESDEEDYIDELPQPSKKVSGPRTSVSAEAFGAWNKKSDYKPRVISKTDDQIRRIVDRLSKAFMFAALDDQEREIVVNSMEERKFRPNEMVITQGDDGNELFVVDSGTLECSKVFKRGEDPKFLKNYGPGEAFGELALLYNAPRAASIKAVTESVCWVLDRACFNHIVKDSAVRKREKYEEFLSRVSLLDDMDPYERSQIADALKEVKFGTDDYVIQEGEWGDAFYIILEGNAIATKVLVPGHPPREVKSYGPGDYFGELALLKGEPRAANIIATSNLKCVTLDRLAFKRMLGPLEDILRRNAVKYEEIIQKLNS